MQRDRNLNEWTDGKLYTKSDMARVGCGDCAGCCDCCKEMEGLILDPWDFCMMSAYLGCTQEELMDGFTSLRLVDGIALPELKEDREKRQCLFLDGGGRCSIHAARPGICRLFPLGRLYDEKGGFSYVLQTHECVKQNRTKVRIEKWLGIPQLGKYETYIRGWHNFCRALRAQLHTLDEAQLRTLHMLILQKFYITHYDKECFYEQFEERRAQVRALLGLE